MESYVTTAKLHGCINEVIWEWERRPGPWKSGDEKVLLVVGVKRRESAKNSPPPSGVLKLKHAIKPNLRLCVFGDEQHCREAVAGRVPCRDMPTIQEINKSIVKVRKLRNRFHVFLASPSLVEQLPDPLLTVLKAAGKSPVKLRNDDTILAQIDKMKRTVKIEAVSTFSLAVAVGNLKMTPNKLADNINVAVPSVVSLLRRRWSDVRYIDIKSDTGPRQRIY